VLCSGLIDGWGVLSILVFVAVIVGSAIGLSLALGRTRFPYPITWACLTGGLVMDLSHPVLNRWLPRIMIGNRAGSAR
jgi:hypothetical protein